MVPRAARRAHGGVTGRPGQELVHGTGRSPPARPAPRPAPPARTRCAATRAGPARGRRCRWPARSRATAPASSSSSGGSRRSGRELISTAVPVRGARREDGFGVEGRLGPAPTDQDPPGAVPEDVGVGALDRPQHPGGHAPGIHPELGVHAGHDHVESGQQLVVLVERAVLQDVDLDPGEDAEGRQLGVEVGDDLELAAQPGSASSPWATVRRGLWSVSAQYRCPRSLAASAISRIGLPPSDQSEWLWQSPCSRPRSSAAAGVGSGSVGGFQGFEIGGRRAAERPRRPPAHWSCRRRGIFWRPADGHPGQLLGPQLGDGLRPRCGRPGPCRTPPRPVRGGRRCAARRPRRPRGHCRLARLGATRVGSSGCLGYSGGQGASRSPAARSRSARSRSGWRDCG